MVERTGLELGYNVGAVRRQFGIKDRRDALTVLRTFADQAISWLGRKGADQRRESGTAELSRAESLTYSTRVSSMYPLPDWLTVAIVAIVAIVNEHDQFIHSAPGGISKRPQ